MHTSRPGRHTSASQQAYKRCTPAALVGTNQHIGRHSRHTRGAHRQPWWAYIGITVGIQEVHTSSPGGHKSAHIGRHSRHTRVAHQQPKSPYIYIGRNSRHVELMQERAKTGDFIKKNPSEAFGIRINVKQVQIELGGHMA